MSIYTVDEPGCGLDGRMVAAVTVPPAAPDQLETLLRRLLPNKVAAELRLPNRHPWSLLEGVQAPKPTPSPKTGLTDMQTLLQGLLLGIPATAPRAGHGVGPCHELSETFPFMLWTG